MHKILHPVPTLSQIKQDGYLLETNEKENK
jgi:hypothetical protein